MKKLSTKIVARIARFEYNDSTKKGMVGCMSVTTTEDVFITKNGKNVAKLTSPYQDRVHIAKSLFGILPENADIEESKKERLGAK